MKQILKKLRVVDFFCGAGGFSEGFRQQGLLIFGSLPLTHTISITT